MLPLGFYGKLPAYGDFIQRNLPAGFVSGWDEWLQHFIAGTREQMGEQWLDIYLTSPIWRFVFSPGVIDKSSWAGIMLPSVDQVGRYFPFSVVTRLPDQLNPLEHISLQGSWYEAIEELALQALDAQLELDELLEQLQALAPGMDSGYVKTGKMLEANSIHVDMDFEEQAPLSVYPYIMDSLLTRMFSSYSVWTTRGSERIMPCLFSVQGLPAVNKLAAMLDGQWEAWGWPQTYMLRGQEM